MRQYIKPQIINHVCTIAPIMVASRNIVNTTVGDFYECGRSACKPLSYTWVNNNDSRNIRRYEQTGTNDWGFPQYDYVKYQYIGCYEYRSNGSGIDNANFHGTTIYEGMQYDLYINASGGYYVEECEDGKHYE